MQVFFKIVINRLIKQLSDYNGSYLEDQNLRTNQKFTALEYIVYIRMLIRMNMQFAYLDWYSTYTKIIKCYNKRFELRKETVYKNGYQSKGIILYII